MTKTNIRIIIALIALLGAGRATAQISATTSNPQEVFSDTTKYFYRDTLKHTQDKIFVFFHPNLGGLQAQRTGGGNAVFWWQRMAMDKRNIDTLHRQVYETFFADTIGAPKARSRTQDTLLYGCYRVLVDTIGVDIIGRDSMLVHADTIPSFITNNGCNTQRMPTSTLCYRGILRFHYPDYEDTTLFVDTMRTALHRADTMRAWLFIDTFLLCGIETPPRQTPCEDPQIIGRYLHNGQCISGHYKYFYYRDLADTILPTRTFPGLSEPYMRQIEWTPSTDIYKDAEKVREDIPAELNSYVPHPLWDAAYKLELTNYFGNTADTTSDTIRAHNVLAKILISTSTDNQQWKDYAEPNDGDKNDAPLHLRAKNASINARDSAVYIWKFYDENAQDTALQRAPMFAYADSVIDLYASERYTYPPGTYPATMKVINKHGCMDSVKFNVEVNEFLMESNNFTEVFSPASTNDNKFFKVKDMAKAKSVMRFEINVMNRYGQLMFSSRDLDFEWDGKIRGSDQYAPDGVYFYAVNVQGLDRKGSRIEQKIKGVVHIFGTNN